MNRGASRLDSSERKGRQPPPSGGATQQKTRVSERLNSYRLHHFSSCIGSLNRLLATPLQTLMTALVVAIALALPAILFVALDNIEQLGNTWDSDPKLSVYIHPRARERAIENLQNELRANPLVKEVVYLTPEQALDDFQQFSGFGQALEALGENPLPASLILSFQNSLASPAQLEALEASLRKNDLVDDVGFDLAWVKRLQELMVLGKKVVTALAGLLGLGALLAVGNTIRLAIENRREEILVTKLVGGTNAFVRRPFLYTGGWYGVIGGVIANAIVSASLFFLAPSVGRLASLYDSQFVLVGLGLVGGLGLLLLSALLGWGGAWLAVGRHLVKIEPK